MKAFLKFSISIFLIFIVLGLSLNLVVNSGWIQKKILAKSFADLEKHTDLRVTVDNVFLNFLFLNFSVKDLEVTDKETLETILTLKKGSFSISLSGLLFARIDISDSVLEGLTSKLRQDQVSNYIDQVAHLFAAATKAPLGTKEHKQNIPINLQRFQMLNAHIDFGLDSLYQGNTLEFALDIQDLTLTGRSNIFSYNLLCSNLRMKNENFDFFRETAVIAQGDIGASGISFDKIQILSHLNDITLSGTFSTPDVKDPLAFPGFLIKLESSIAKGDFSLLGAFLDIHDTYGEVTGAAQVEIKIPTGSEQKVQLNVDVDAEVKHAVLYGFDLLESKGKLNIDMDGIQFRDVILRQSGKNLGAALGSIAFNERGDIQFSGSMENITLKVLFHALGIDQDVINGELSARDFKLQGSSSPFKLEITGAGDVGRLSMPIIGPEFSEKYKQYSPICDYSLNLVVQIEKISFDGTRLTCAPSKALATNTKGKKAFALPSTHIDAAIGAKNTSAIELEGGIYLDAKSGLDLHVSSHQFDTSILAFILGSEVRGIGQLTTKISGSYQNFNFYNDLDLTEMSIYGLQFFKGKLNFVLGSSTITWEHLRLTASEGSKEIHLKNGKLTLDKNLYFYTKVRAEHIHDLHWESSRENFQHGHTVNIKGLDLLGEISGPLLQPLNWQGNLDFNSSTINYDEFNLVTSVRGQFSGKGSSFLLDISELSSGNVSFNSMFTIKKEKSLQGEASPSGFLAPLFSMGLSNDDYITFKLATMEMGKKGDNYLSTLGMAQLLRKNNIQEAKINTKLSLSGHPHQISGSLEGSLTEIIVNNSSWPGVRFKSFLQNDEIDVLAHFASNGLKIRFKTALSDPQRPYFLFASATRLDLRYLLGAQFADNPQNFVYFTGETELEGSLTHWEQSKGWIKIGDIWFSLNPKERRKIEGHLLKPLYFKSVVGGWIERDNSPFILDSEEFKIEILPSKIETGKNLNIALKSRFNLANLPIFFPAIESASGEVIAQGKISGSITHPEINIDITDVPKNTFNQSSWKPLTLSLADIRPPLKDINVHATVESDRIVLHNFFAKKGHGFIKAHGSYAFDEQNRKDSKLEVELSSAKIIYPVAVFKSFETDLTGTIELDMSRFPIDINGAVVVSKARNTRDFNIRSEIITALRSRKYIESGVQIPPIANLNLKISCDDGLVVTTRNINARFSANLTIKGTDRNPSAIGNIEVVKGRFLYKRDFEVVRGMITFDNPNKIEPVIDLVAESEISPYRVILTIVGEASNPSVELSIDPSIKPDGTPISVVDILVLLSRGKFPASNALSTDASEAISSEALSLLIGQIEQPVEKLIELSGQNVVKQVYIDTYVSEETGQTGIKLALPLNITKDLDVIVSTESTASEASRLGVSSEYSLHDHVALSAELQGIGQAETQQNQLDGSLDIKFRFNFP